MSIKTELPTVTLSGPDAPDIAYTRPPRCKACGQRMKVTSTRAGFRYVRCPQCLLSEKQSALLVTGL